MANILIHAHSGLRWLFLALLVFAIFNAFRKWQSDIVFTESDRKLNLYTMIFAHVQLLMGLALFFTSGKVIFSGGSMKDSAQRFFLVEHPIMMILAIAFITVGNIKSKRLVESAAKFKATVIYFVLGLLLLLAGIPWPFREALGAGWF